MNKEIQKICAQSLEDLGGVIKLFGERWGLYLDRDGAMEKAIAGAVKPKKEETNENAETESEKAPEKPAKAKTRRSRATKPKVEEAETTNENGSRDTEVQDAGGEKASTPEKPKKLSMEDVRTLWREKLQQAGWDKIKYLREKYDFKSIAAVQEDDLQDVYDELLTIKKG